MSIWKLEPKYGSVTQLCQNLGYGSKVEGDPYHYSVLSDKTAEYRAIFMNHDTRSTVPKFPMTYDEGRVQQCAFSFLAEHRDLFLDILDDAASGAEIVVGDGIAKLMCRQEWDDRNNSESRATFTRKERRSSKTVDIADAPYEEYSDDVGPEFPPTPASSVCTSNKNNEESSSEEDDEELYTRMEEHLDFTYPLDEWKVGFSTEWIFQKGAKCPENVLPLVFRYLHQEELYSVQVSTQGAIAEFKNYLTDHLQIECSSSKDSIHLYERCKTLVLSSSKTWKKWGLLKKKDGDWKRNKKFEPVWKLRRDKWKRMENCQLLEDDTGNVLESSGGESSGGRSSPVWSVWSPPPRDLKRGRVSSDAPSPTNYCLVKDKVASNRNSPVEEPEKVPSRINGDGSKKARIVATLGTSASTCIDLTGDGVLPNDDLKATGSLNADANKNTGFQFRAPTAPMFIGIHGDMAASCIVNEFKVETSCEPQTPLFESAQASDEILAQAYAQPLRVSPSDILNADSMAGFPHDGLPKTIKMEGVSDIYVPNSHNPTMPRAQNSANLLPTNKPGSLNVPPKAKPIPSVPPTNLPKHTQPRPTIPNQSKARLMFQLEIEKDIINFDTSKDIPQKELTDIENLSGLFTFLSKKAPNVFGSCDGLIFQYRWNLETLGPLYDTDGDGSWRSMKTALKDQFRRAKREKPNVKTFYIVVKRWEREEIRSMEGEGEEEDDESVW